MLLCHLAADEHRLLTQPPTDIRVFALRSPFGESHLPLRRCARCARMYPFLLLHSTHMHHHHFFLVRLVLLPSPTVSLAELARVTNAGTSTHTHAHVHRRKKGAILASFPLRLFVSEKAGAHRRVTTRRTTTHPETHCVEDLRHCVAPPSSLFRVFPRHEHETSSHGHTSTPTHVLRREQTLDTGAHAHTHAEIAGH